MSSYASNVVPKECEGMRLDAYMASQGLYPTRSAAAKCIADGYCALNGKLPRKSASVCAGDVLEYETYEDPHAPELVAADIPLDIRYEDDYLLVISKQAGLVCHPAEGHYGDTLVNALIAHCGKENLCDVQGEQDRLGIVHRLDRDTSGLMLCAKTNEVGLALMEDIRLKDVDRHYLALVQGWIPLDTGIVDAPIARGGRDRLRMEVSDREDARPSITTFTVKRRFEPGKNDDGFTLIDCKLFTGRTHQIRVHMQYAKHPLVGDPVYTANGPKDARAQLGLKRQFLHSFRIRFTHPETSEELEFADNLPRDLDEALRSLDDRSRGMTDAGREVAALLADAPRPSVEGELPE